LQDVKQAYGVQDYVLGAFKPVQDVKLDHGVLDLVLGALGPLCRMKNKLIGSKIMFLMHLSLCRM
jgi:hypothetical protein